MADRRADGPSRAVTRDRLALAAVAVAGGLDVLVAAATLPALLRLRAAMTDSG